MKVVVLSGSPDIVAEQFEGASATVFLGDAVEDVASMENCKRPE